MEISSSKTDKNEYLTNEGLLPSDQIKMIEQATFTYYSLRKAFEKQVKTIEI